MKWIKDKPKLIGEWYWFRKVNAETHSPTPIPVYVFDKDHITVDASIFKMNDFEGEWSHCPIPFPDED